MARKTTKKDQIASNLTNIQTGRLTKYKTGMLAQHELAQTTYSVIINTKERNITQTHISYPDVNKT
jgi:hypothetical protein